MNPTACRKRASPIYAERTAWVVCYDVDTENPEGRRRLRKVAKVCEAFGSRVQKSVFECVLTAAQKERMAARLAKVIDPAEDSLRIYRLTGRIEDVREVLGKPDFMPVGGLLIV